MALNPAGRLQRVSDVMTAPVHTTTTATPVATVAAALRHLRVSALPVLDEEGRVVGVVSELDLLRAGADRGAGGRAGDVMRTPVRCLSPGTSAAAAADQLVHDGLRSMPVVRGGDLVGIVSRGDLLATGVRRPDPLLPPPPGSTPSPAGAGTHAGAPVTVAVDRSPQALLAVRAAAAEAVRRRAPLRIVHVDRGAAEDLLTRARRSVADLVVAPDLRTAVRSGDVARVLVDETTAACLLVLGGHPGDRLAGPAGTAARVVAHAACPVLVLPDEDGPPVLAGRSVVAGVSGGPGDAAVLQAAFDEAVARGADLVPVHALDDPVVGPTHRATGRGTDRGGVRDEGQHLLSEALAGLSERFPAVVVRPEVLRAGRAVALRSASLTAELLVVGHRHRGRLAGLGSTTRALLHGVPCPVLVVPLPAHPRTEDDREHP